MGFPDESGGAAALLRHHRYRAAPARGLRPGGRWGIYGFGARRTSQPRSRSTGTPRARTERAPRKRRRLALELGCASAARRRTRRRRNRSTPRSCLRPVGRARPGRHACARPRGTLSVAGIYLSDVPRLVTPTKCSRRRRLRARPPTRVAMVSAARARDARAATRPRPCRTNSTWRPGAARSRARRLPVPRY